MKFNVTKSIAPKTVFIGDIIKYNVTFEKVFVVKDFFIVKFRRDEIDFVKSIIGNFSWLQFSLQINNIFHRICEVR